MNPLLAKITHLEKASPDKTAIIGSAYSLSYRTLKKAIGTTADKLINQCHGVIGLLMDNCPAWVVIDLASQATQTTLVPLPIFYTDEQIQHVIDDAEIQWILTDKPARFIQYQTSDFIAIGSDSIIIMATFASAQRPAVAPTISKISYTSGTTGQAKGVCLNQQSLLAVSQSLFERSQARASDRHLSLMPLAILLENIATVYTCILAECTSCIPSMAEMGFNGSSTLDVKQQLAVLTNYQATSAIVMPHVLEALVLACESGTSVPKSLRFLSVAGATVSQSLLLRADACGLPVFQGYGLSECASVVSLNSPGQNRIGSVGKILPHLQVKISDQSEVLVKGPIFDGYLHDNNVNMDLFLATGDIGFIDDDNYLYISGRKKTQFITSFGRNIDPEWVQDALTETQIITRAFVYGEARPWNTAILFAPQDMTFNRELALSLAVQQANKKLPDYAQIKQWLDGGDGQDTILIRGQVYSAYKEQIDALYDTELCCS